MWFRGRNITVWAFSLVFINFVSLVFASEEIQVHHSGSAKGDIVASNKGSPNFLFRTNPVRLHIESSDLLAGNFSESQAYILANLLGIDAKRDANRSNLIILIGENLISNGKAESSIINNYINDNIAAQKIANSNIWGGGCGTFIGSNKKDDIGFSISLINDDLPKKIMLNCTINSVFLSFGIFSDYTHQNNRSLLEIGIASANALRFCQERDDRRIKCAHEVYKKISNNINSVME